jgi:hypothetical protein
MKLGCGFEPLGEVFMLIRDHWGVSVDIGQFSGDCGAVAIKMMRMRTGIRGRADCAAGCSADPRFMSHGISLRIDPRESPGGPVVEMYFCYFGSIDT